MLYTENIAADCKNSMAHMNAVWTKFVMLNIIAADCKKSMAHVKAVWTKFVMLNIISGSIQVYTNHQGLKDYISNF